MSTTSTMPHSQFDSSLRENGSITGTVNDTHNKPVKDVRVELTNSNGVAVSSAYTNSSGMFEFSRVAPGPYTVVATAGLQQSSERVEVSGWTNTVTIHMPVSDKPEEGASGNSVSVAQLKIPSKAREEYRKSREALQKDKLEDAKKHLAKALEIYPNYADALTLRAVLALNQKDSEAAIADLDQAIKADANCAMAYMVMGSALNMQSKF
ncbi:MAG TPA: carboxypeptidase regulatory-like domain-containing protein, partial [Candidatus Sulfotelmatobacter sp.]|nr:carboxypeptidase regulatory-like domain-containing protein [Candidatus Sulfotelmatobacter sp.]